MDDIAFDRANAPAELRTTALERALRAARPVSDAVARRSRQAARVVSRQATAASRYSTAQLKARPLAAAALALGAGLLVGALLSPRRRLA